MKYLKYFLYIIEHKSNVAIECFKMGLYWHAFTHDLSKFLPDEFFPYANWFFDKKIQKSKKDRVLNNDVSLCKKKFEYAWEKHKKRNKHHWNSPEHFPLKYQIIPEVFGKEEIENCDMFMEEKYIKQMVCDWNGMGRKFGGNAKEYYKNNKNKIKLSKESILILEKYLND